MLSSTLAEVLRAGRVLLGHAARVTSVLGGIFLFAVAPTSAQTQFVTINGDLKAAAWWVLADFQPFTTEVRGIPANQIRKNWCKATEFRKDLIPRELLFENGSDQMAQAELSFALEGRFDGSLVTQIALVGVYQECSGKKGRFILIIDRPAGGPPKIRFVNAIATDRQFGALARGKDNTLVAWACMECDGYSTLKWNRKSRKFEWQSAPAED
jgi:hypothetical protein